MPSKKGTNQESADSVEPKTTSKDVKKRPVNLRHHDANELDLSEQDPAALAVRFTVLIPNDFEFGEEDLPSIMFIPPNNQVSLTYIPLNVTDSQISGYRIGCKQLLLPSKMYKNQPYKYAIVKPDQKIEWEKFHSHENVHRNRCLSIGRDFNGLWEQIDFVMEGTQTGLIGQVVHFFKSLRVDKYQRNRLMALEYFLPSWDSQKGFQSKLKSGNSAPSLSETADEMSLVINRYERLLYRTINHWQIRDEQNKLFEAIEEILQKFVIEAETNCERADVQLQTALTALIFLTRQPIQIHTELFAQYFHLLRIRFSPGDTISALEALKVRYFIGGAKQKEELQIVLNAMCAAFKAVNYDPFILYAIPVFDFLRRGFSPDKLTTRPFFDDVNLIEREVSEQDWNKAVEVLSDSSYRWQCDPKFLNSFLEIFCRKANLLAKLEEKIWAEMPICALMNWFSCLTRTRRFLVVEKANPDALKLFERIANTLYMRNWGSESCKTDLDNYDTIVVTFVDASLGRMKSCDFSSRELIYRYTMQICRIIDASLVYVKKVDSSTFASLFTKSREWLNQIGKLLEPFARREIDKLRFEEESHAWMEMLNQQLKELSEDYLNLMETIFRLRLDNLNLRDKDKVNLIDLTAHRVPKLKRFFDGQMEISIKKAFSSERLQELEELLATPGLAHFIFSKVFFERWQANGNPANENELLSQILSFPHLNICLRILNTSQGRADIWPAALELIDELNRFLERLATACSNRSITVDQLVAVTATRSRFLSLLCTVQLSKLTDDYLIRLEQGAIEFRNVRAALRVIMGFAQELDIREKLSATESSVHMSSLVEPSGESAVLKHFDINPRWRKQLSSVERWCESRIFISVMNKALIQPEVKLESVEDLLNQVLGVAITEISKIVADIKSAQILLAVLDQLFEDSQITGCTQITEEFMKIDPSYQMIKPKLELYDKYLSIRRLGTGAETILKLVEKLGLKGSFEELVKVKTMSCGIARMKLCNISGKTLTCGKFLESLTTDKIACIDALVDASELTDWISSKAEKELEAFVDIATANVGQSSMEQSIINNFNIAVSGFAPLVWLPKDAGFDILQKAMRTLFSSLEKDPELPRKLAKSSENLRLLQSYWEATGSLEKHSISQVEEICQLGRFRVKMTNLWGTHDTELTDNVDMVLASSAVDGKEKTLTLTELTDLHSRLMLIGGQMKAEQKTKEKINRFSDLFEEILKLKELYRQHYMAGNVFFLEFRATIHCDPSLSTSCFVEFKGRDLIRLRGAGGPKDSVQLLCRVMRQTLDEWKEFINKQRQECPELNNFSNSQIVTLRRQLAQLINDDQLQPEAAMMLMALSNNICFETLVKATRQCSLPRVGQTSLSDGVVQMDMDVFDQLKELGMSPVAAMKVGNLTGWEGKAALEYAADNWDELMEQTEQPNESTNGNSKTGESELNGVINMLLEKTMKNNGEIYEKELMDLWHKHLHLQETHSASDFLSLWRLCDTLRELSRDKSTIARRVVPPWVKRGEANVVMVPMADVLKYLVAAHMENSAFPSNNEVLLCRQTTTEEDLILFFNRMRQQPRADLLYSIAFPERLVSSICRLFEKLVEQVLQETGSNGCLAMFCGQENFLKSPISGMWTNCHRSLSSTATWTEVAHYVRRNIQVSENIHHVEAETMLGAYKANLVTSIGCGQGKSLLIQRQTESLQYLHRKQRVIRIKVPVYHSQINSDLLVELLLPHAVAPDYEKRNIRVIQIDFINNLAEIDEFLFELLVLGCISDSKGRIWRLLPQDLYAIEITSPASKYLLPVVGDQQNPDDLHLFRFTLPTVMCLSPADTMKIEEANEGCFTRPGVLTRMFDEAEISSFWFQRCYYYLSTKNDPNAISDFNPDRQAPATRIATLACLLKHIGINEPSWMELKHFVDFLNVQLHDYEQSNYCLPELAEYLPGFRQFVLAFLIEMSQDFATRSLKISEEMAGLLQDKSEQLEGYHVKRNWENRPHPYLFFNEDLGDVNRARHTFSFFGCTIDEKGNLLIKGQLYKRQFITPMLVQRLTVQRVNLQQDFEALPAKEKLQMLQRVLGVPETDVSPDPNYQITADCAMKICAIHMRHRSNIPVCVMGETGCGKTRLIEFMYNLMKQGIPVNNLITYKIHGGTTFNDLSTALLEAVTLAHTNWKNLKIPTCLFFDEANSTEAMAMIKEILCDGTLRGERLDLANCHLQLIAAVNPYRKHTDAMIKKLESAGLGYHGSQDQYVEKFGEIPLRHLVYRVRPLPTSMLPLVWDFGTLTPETEGLYIKLIVERFVQDRTSIQAASGCLVEILKAAQDFMRNQNAECSFVSLRDVERALSVIDWFYRQRDPIFVLVRQEFNKRGHSKEMAKDDIVRAIILGIGVCYRASLPESRHKFDEFIAKKFVGQLSLTTGACTIEREIRMCQNVLINAVELDANVARNDALCENLFMMFICIELRIPLFLVGKPGSSKSLAKSIVAKAMRGQTSQCSLLQRFKKAQIFSYQCSPLATADGVESVFKQCASYQKDVNLNQHVAVAVFDEIGLAEDSPQLPLKALHGLLEGGCSINDEALEGYHKISFVGISNWALDPAKMNRGIFISRILPTKQELLKTAKSICQGNSTIYSFIESAIEPLTNAYHEIYNSQKDMEFFGLRDFYSLLKMIYDLVARHPRKLQYSNVVKAIQHNFSGRDEEKTRAIFLYHLRRVMDIDHDDAHVSPVLELIEENLSGFPNTERDSRYLLILTENLSALRLLHQIPQLTSATVFFGSNFPEDLEYSQICRSINRIKVCMDVGGTVVLLNLEILYESLYDLLNQAFISWVDEKFVDLGLGTHRLKCHVNKDFRLVVIADRDEALQRFPVALINRLEKYFYTTETDMTKPQRDLVRLLKDWVDDFVTYKSKSFTPFDCFIGYHRDAPASLVAEVFDRNTNLSADQLLIEAKKLLVQCATPESIIRLTQGPLATEADDIFRIYFEEQHHSGLLDLLHQQGSEGSTSKKFFEITTHSRLMSTEDFDVLKQSLKYFKKFHRLQLEEFQTEVAFGKELDGVFKDGENNQQLLVIQCLSGNDSGRLVAFAKYKIQEKLRCQSDAKVLVVFLVTLHRGGVAKNFIGLQGGLVESYHIDDIGDFSRPREMLHKISDYRGKKISDLINEFLSNPAAALVDFGKLLKDSIHLTVSSLVDPSNRKAERISMLSSIMELNNNFIRIVVEFLLQLQTDREVTNTSVDWFNKLATDVSNILENRTFKQALLKKLESNIVPLFAGILSQLDIAFNCSLLDCRTNTWQSQLFLELFRCKDLVNFRFRSSVFFSAGEFPQPLDKFCIPQPSSLDFNCRFPFSWLLKKKVDEFLTIQEKMVRGFVNQTSVELEPVELTDLNEQDGMESLNEDEEDSKMETNEASVLADSHTILERTVWGKILVDLSEHQLRDYLHDLVYWSFRITSHEQSELITPWIWNHVDQKTVLSLHKAVLKLKPNVERFLSLTNSTKWSQIVEALLAKQDILDRHRNATDYCAFIFVIELLENHAKQSYTSSDDSAYKESVRNWLEEVQSCLPFMEAFLEAPSTIIGPEEFKSRWQKVKIFYLFMLHTIHINYRFSVQGLWKLIQQCQLGGQKTKEFMEKCDNVLKMWNQKMRMDLLKNGTTIRCAKCSEIVESTTPLTAAEFLACLHVVHSNCLDGLERCPNRNCLTTIASNFRDVAALNLSTAQVEYKSARQALNSFYMDLLDSFVFRPDERPSSELVEMLFQHITRVSPATNTETTAPCFPVADDWAIDTTPVIRSFLLQLLLKYSYENVSEHLDKYFIDAKRFTRDARDQAHLRLLCVTVLEDMERSKVSFLPLEEKIKMARTNWDRIAQLLQEEDEISFKDLHSVANFRFVVSVYCEAIDSYLSKKINLSDMIVFHTKMRNSQVWMQNSNAKLYLCKQLHRAYGNQKFMQAVEDPNFSWIMPIHIQSSDEVDWSLIYDGYLPIKHEVFLAINSGMSAASFVEKFNKTRPNWMASLFMASFYTGWTLQRDDATKFLIAQQHPLLEGSKMEKWTDLLNRSVELRELCGPHSYIPQLISHTIASLSTNQNSGLTQFLQELLSNPDRLNDSFFPTMPESYVAEVAATLRTVETLQWYKCPNNHLYSVANCGKPMETATCRECGAPIGGLRHTPLAGNAPIDIQGIGNTTKKRHCLTLAQNQTLAPERMLNLQETKVMRALLHSCLLATSLRHFQEVSGLCGENVIDPLSYFKRQLDFDLQHLATHFHKNIDDIIVILMRIWQNVSASDVIRVEDPLMLKRTSRGNWERLFADVFIKPIVENLTEELASAKKVAVNPESSTLNAIMYELVETTPTAFALWGFRSPNTFEEISAKVQKMLVERKKPIELAPLMLFLENEPWLRPLRYLPSVTRLHLFLKDHLKGFVDTQAIKSLPIRTFLKEIGDADRDRVECWINDFFEAWKLCLPYLQNSRLGPQGGNPNILHPLPLEYSPSINDYMENSLLCLIPVDTDAGKCALALLEYLIFVQNSFVEEYRKTITSSERAKNFQDSHPYSCTKDSVIAYDPEEDLMPLLLMHRIIQFKVGSDRIEASFDLLALQRRIESAFIYNAHSLKKNELLVLKTKESLMSEIFAQLREKGKNMDINLAQKHEILTQMSNYLSDVHQTFELVELLVKFVFSFNENETLVELVDKLSLQKHRGFKEKVLANLTTNELISLWQLVALKRNALLLSLENAEPFGDSLKIYAEPLETNLKTKLIAFLTQVELCGFVCHLTEFLLIHLPRDLPAFANKDNELMVYLEEYCPDLKFSEAVEFPDEICLKHTINVWKLAVERFRNARDF